MPEAIAPLFAEQALAPVIAEAVVAPTISELAGSGAISNLFGSTGSYGLTNAVADPLMAGLRAGANAYNASGLASLAQQGVASGFSAPNYLAQLGNAGVAPVAEAAPALSPFQAATNQGVLGALQPTQPLQVPEISPVTTMQAPVNAAPEIPAQPSNLYNAADVYRGGQIPSTDSIQSLAQGRGLPVEQFGAPPVATSSDIAAPTDLNAEVSSEPVGSYENVVKGSDLGSQDKAIELGKNMTGDTWGDIKRLASNPNWQNIKDFAGKNPYTTGLAGLTAYNMLKPKAPSTKMQQTYIRPYQNTRMVSPTVSYYTPYSGGSTAERNYFTGGLEALPIYGAASGGLTSLAVGGPVETMSAINSTSGNTMYPQSQFQTDIYSNPNVQRPYATNMIDPSGDVAVDPYTGEEKFADGGDVGGYRYSYDPASMQFTQLSEPASINAQIAAGQAGDFNSIGNRFQPKKVASVQSFSPVVTGGISQPAIQPASQPMAQQAAQTPINIPAYQSPEQQLGLSGFYDYMNQQLAGMRGQGMAAGGVSSLGGYSDGGRLLRGPGDGVSDSIPASIGDRQPARLADGEFVVPARIVSELGNGSTEAGARKLYAMMDRVQKARRNSVGKDRVAVNSKADRYLPA